MRVACISVDFVAMATSEMRCVKRDIVVLLEREIYTGQHCNTHD